MNQTELKGIQEFIELAQQAGVEELKYKSGAKEYFVKIPFESTPGKIPLFSNEPEPAPKPQRDTSITEIVSPFVGTFYIAPSADAQPYVNRGDRVKPGQILCIVEAMKIMNEIESEISGEIVEICVENENYVEFGQTLFKIKK